MKNAAEKNKKNRLSLAFLLAGFIFAFLIVTLLVAVVVGYFLIELNIMDSVLGSELSTVEIVLLVPVISLVMGFLLSFAAGRIPLMPVNRIITQTNRLASGDYKARLSFQGSLSRLPAVKEACESFNKLAQELETTETLRNDFINNFSHEFKTPIVSIAGFAKLLKRGDLTQEQRLEFLDIIEEESMRLSSLATNMLNLSKYENQTILSDLILFNLSEQIRSCIVMLEAKWSKKQIEFDLELEEHLIRADREMLMHVWLNLIDNAIKFSPEGGTVQILLREEDNAYVVFVRNRGEVLSPEQQRMIFTKFYQADESRAAEGNGIGLALAKKVTELHKGKIGVTCEDSWVEFFVTLPKEQ